MREGHAREEKEKKRGAAGFSFEGKLFGRRGSITFTNIKFAADFNPEYIKLKSGGVYIVIKGEGLEISVYENKITEIKGRIKEVKFE